MKKLFASSLCAPAFLASSLLAVGAPDFEAEVKPILERSCAKCHAYGDRQGGLSMETRESLLQGGDNGKVVVPGETQGSLLLNLLTEKDAADRMPQKADPLPPEEVAALTAWVKAGLPWEEGFAFRHPKAPMAPRNVKPPPVQEGVEHPVDRFLLPYYAKRGFRPPAPADDRTFLRRVHLDLIGLPPTLEQYAAYAEDKHPDKAKRLVNALLADDEHYMQHWLTFWNDALRNSYTRQYHGGNKYRLTNWLKESLKTNKPYDQFARELLAPTAGDRAAFIDGIKWRGTVNSSQVVEMQAAQNVAQVFLGLNLKCASCHDSFINDWTLEQAYAFASVFANAPMEEHRCDKPTGKKVPAAFVYPELGAVDPTASRNARLKQLAELMTKKENGRFSRVIVNRLWAAFFGRGLVEPVDEMDNPPWNADLLDWLAHDFAAHGHDLRRAMGLLATSQAYCLPAVEPVPDQQPEAFVFRGPLVRRLRAEQFLDALALLGEAAAPPPKRPAFQRHGLRNLDPLQRVLGRPKRDQVSTSRDDRPTTLQALALSNGDLMHKAVTDAGKRWAASKRPAEQLVEELFLHAFLRKPKEAEKVVALELLGGGTPDANAVADLVWTLVLQPEFQLLR